MQLWKHQEETVDRIIKDQGVHALLHEPGAGKTLTTIAYLESLVWELQRPIRVIVVVPKSALGVWPEQMAQHSVIRHVVDVQSGPIKKRLERLRAPVTGHSIEMVVLPYSTFSGNRTKKACEPILHAFKMFEPDVVVLDEMHHIRGAQSNTSKTFGLLSELCPRRLGLTGTPTPHSPADVYGMWRWLDPSAFAGPSGKMVSYTRWLQGYAKFGGFQGQQIVGWFDQEDLEERISRRSSVVKTADCHSLPPLIIQTHRFDLSPAEKRAYDQMRKDLLAVVDDEHISAANKVVSILRLRQIAAGFLPSETGDVHEIGRTRRDLVLSLSEDLLASERRLVILAWSRHEVDAVYTDLQAASPWGAQVRTISGRTSAADREKILQEFASDSGRLVLVAQVDSMASGTNALVGASHMLYLSLTQMGANWTQSLCRLHRPGQAAEKVVAHVLQASGTIDCTMLESLQGRADSQASLMAHIQEASK